MYKIHVYLFIPLTFDCSSGFFNIILLDHCDANLPMQVIKGINCSIDHDASKCGKGK